MDEYKVEITETLQKTVTVIAANEDDAIDRVANRYGNAEDGYVLDAEDFKDVNYEVTE